MAIIRIKRVENLPASPTLLPGELAVAGNKLYYGK
jgi:hypothetical protein